MSDTKIISLMIVVLGLSMAAKAMAMLWIATISYTLIVIATYLWLTHLSNSLTDVKEELRELSMKVERFNDDHK